MATVYEDGLISAVAPGSTQIIVNGSVSVSVTVNPPISIFPTQTTAAASETRQFTARLGYSVDPVITWSLSPAVGNIDANGLYTAPDSVTSQQIVTVTAANAADPTQTASAAITLTTDAYVRVAPEWETLYGGQSLKLTSALSNTGGSGVVWSVSPAGIGSISSDGTYTAPSSVTSLQSITIQATSASNPAIAGTATVWISPQPFLFAPIDPLAVAQSTSATANISLLATDGFQHPVTFSVGGLPDGVTASFSPTATTGTAVTALTITAGPIAPPGTYNLTITGTDTVYAPLTQTQPMQLVISGSQFTLSAANPSLAGTPGASTTATLTEAVAPGFTEPVALTATGLPEGVSASFSPATLAGSGTTTLTLSIGDRVAPGVYVFVVTGTGTSTGATWSQPVTLTVSDVSQPQRTLPSNWQNQDIGGVRIPGSSGYSGGVFKITGSGIRSSTTLDQFQYAFTSLAGDGVIIARLTNVPLKGKAGIMIRDSAGPDASYAYVYSGSALELDYRDTSGTSGTWEIATGGTSSIWLKLVRTGNQISAYTSHDGVAWNHFGEPVTVNITVNALAGLAVSSEDRDSWITASFDNVSVTPASGFSLSSSSGSLTISSPGSAEVTLLQTAGSAFSDIVSYSASGLPPGVTANFSPASLSGSGNVSLALSAAPDMQPGAYTLTIVGTSSNSGVTQSLPLAVTITPTLVTSVSVSPSTAALSAGGAQQFTATVLHNSNTAVNWTISPNLGSISNTGLYTAPATVASQQNVIVTATSVGDPSKSAAASITLTPPVSAGACQITYVNANDWGSGFTGNISITNNGSSSIEKWTLAWSWSGNQQISESWSSHFSQDGTSVTMTNADWNGVVAAGSTIAGIGFNANYSGSNLTPPVFFLNGVQCGGGTSANAPPAPANLSASAISSGEIDLSWTAIGGSGITYNVYSGASPNFVASPASQIASGITGSTFVHTGLAASTTHYYVVTAVNQSGESAASNQVAATTGGASCKVNYVNQSDWGTGFTAGISITNTSASDIRGWTLTWRWSGDQQISGAWNANSAQNGSNVTLTNVDSNGAIAQGTTVSGIGFNASYSTTNTPPAAFFLNGVQCQ